MYIFELFEARPALKTVVILPGGFHPFHPGHLSLYNSAQKAFPGADIYYAATNDKSERPFDIVDKARLAQIAGVPAGHFVQVTSPFKAQEILSKYDPNTTAVVFARSEKDRDEPPRPGITKKDGSPGYLQLWDGNPKPLTQNGYMAYLPVKKFPAGPSGVTSATQIRTMWPKADDQTKASIVQDLYPGDPKTATKILNKYLSEDANAYNGMASIDSTSPVGGIDVTEAFNQPYGFKWEHNDESHDALVKLPDGSNLSMMFSLDYGAYGDEEWTVEFWRGNSQEVTGAGDQQRVFATVLEAIRQFIEMEHPERIRFSANKDVEPGQKSLSRTNLYNKLVKRYANSWGYNVDVDDFADTTVYNLYTMNEGVAEAKAATARFRTGNKKRAELNAMSDEERRAYDREQQEKQRRRDDARLEREREKNAAKKGVAEGVDYMSGHCHVMALALKKLHPDWRIRAHIGWDEEAEEDEDYRVDHVYIVAPDGTAYDCRGQFDSEEQLVGPDETGGVETQFVDYDIDDIKDDILRGELKPFTKQDLESAAKFAQNIKKPEMAETIRKVSGGYRLVSRKGKNLGTYPTHAGAEKRERQVQYFKHRG